MKHAKSSFGELITSSKWLNSYLSKSNEHEQENQMQQGNIDNNNSNNNSNNNNNNNNNNNLSNTFLSMQQAWKSSIGNKEISESKKSNNNNNINHNSIDKNELELKKLMQELKKQSYHRPLSSSTPSSVASTISTYHNCNHNQLNLIGFMEFDPKSAASNSYDKKSNHGSRSSWFNL